MNSQFSNPDGSRRDPRISVPPMISHTLPAFMSHLYPKSKPTLSLHFQLGLSTQRPQDVPMSKDVPQAASYLSDESAKILRIPCLDERILEKIYQYLSLVDQVCLSLSCKDLFSLFGKRVKHKDLKFPRPLRIRNPILCVNSPHVLQINYFFDSKITAGPTAQSV